jgi:hypothetical protein
VQIGDGIATTLVALLDRGANVHAQTAFGDTPLHYACIRGYTYVVASLIDRGRDGPVWHRRDSATIQTASRYLRSGRGAADRLFRVEFGFSFRAVGPAQVAALLQRAEAVESFLQTLASAEGDAVVVERNCMCISL